jgi:hypothetical protein
MKSSTIKNAYQMKVLIMLNEFHSRGKITELEFGLKYLNKIVTRFYIDAYWKVGFFLS